MKKHPDVDLLIQKGMNDLLMFPLLVSHKHGLTGVVRHQDCTGVAFINALPLYLAQINQGEGQPVCQKGPEFLHHIQSQTWATGTIPVQKSYRRIKPHRLQGRPDVMHKERINEGQQGVDVVQRWPAVPLLKGKSVLLRYYQVIEDAEIDMGGVPLATSENIKRPILIQLLQIVVQALYGKSHLICIQFVRMITERPLENRPAVGNLAGQNRAGHIGGGLWIISLPILLTPQEDIP